MRNKLDFKKNNLDENMYRKNSPTTVKAIDILKEPTTPHAQQQNGVEKRMNCALIEMTDQCDAVHKCHSDSGQKQCPRLFTYGIEVQLHN